MSRMVNIILTELASDVMKHEEAMETAINGKGDINERIGNIKYHLNKIVETEAMIEKWKYYTSSVNNNKQ
jgi:hypothetical protein